jgi:hypothetical protein
MIVTKAPSGHTMHVVSFGTLALVFTAAFAGCGDYDPKTPAAPAGSGSTTSVGGLTSGGQTAMAGTGGSAAQAPVVADCTAVGPCGGAVTGNWVVAGSCLPVSGAVDMSGFGLGCTMGQITGSLEVAGTWSATADGRFTDGTTTSGDAELVLAPECLNISGTVTTCDRLGGAFQALGFAQVDCVNAASGGGCTCDATVQQTGGLATVTLSPAASGSYASANNVLTTTTAGVETTYAYCVSGNRMTMTPQTVTKAGALTGTIVLVKP